MMGKSRGSVEISRDKGIAYFLWMTARIILETDGTAIASRVSRPKADASDIVINEQTIMNACKYRKMSVTHPD